MPVYDADALSPEKPPIIEIVLSQDEIKKYMDLGIRRNEHNIAKGKSHRHAGMEGGRAHGIGLIGEKGFRIVLDANGIKYTVAPEWDDDPRKWKQDITIDEITYGVKTKAVKTFADTFKSRGESEPYFYYPAKDQAGESKRVLGYPDFIVACSANPETGQVWIFAWIEGQEARKEEYRNKGGYPAHFILWSHLHPISKLGIFRGQPIKLPEPPPPLCEKLNTPYYDKIRAMSWPEYSADLVRRQTIDLARRTP
jgi:hypothetical protein